MTDAEDEARIKAAQELAAKRIKERENVAARDQEGKRIADEVTKGGKP